MRVLGVAGPTGGQECTGTLVARIRFDYYGSWLSEVVEWMLLTRTVQAMHDHFTVPEADPAVVELAAQMACVKLSYGSIIVDVYVAETANPVASRAAGASVVGDVVRLTLLTSRWEGQFIAVEESSSPDSSGSESESAAGSSALAMILGGILVLLMLIGFLLHQKSQNAKRARIRPAADVDAIALNDSVRWPANHTSSIGGSDDRAAGVDDGGGSGSGMFTRSTAEELQRAEVARPDDDSDEPGTVVRRLSMAHKYPFLEQSAVALPTDDPESPRADGSMREPAGLPLYPFGEALSSESSDFDPFANLGMRVPGIRRPARLPETAETPPPTLPGIRGRPGSRMSSDGTQNKWGRTSVVGDLEVMDRTE